MGKAKVLANTVRVFYNATNTEKTPPKERFEPIIIDGGADTFVFLPLGPAFVLQDVSQKVEGSGARVTIVNKAYVWQTKVENKKNWHDVPLHVWKTWNAVGSFKRKLSKDGVLVLVTEQDMFKKSHGDLEQMDVKLRDKMDVSRMLDEEIAAKQAKLAREEERLLKLAAQASGSPTTQS